MGSASNSSAGVVASAASCSAVRAPRRCPDCEAMTTPAPPWAMTLPNSSSSTAVPYRSTARIAAGDLAQPRGHLDERLQRLARGHINGGGADLEPGVVHDLGGGVGIPLPQV